MTGPQPTREKPHMELRCQVDPSLLGMLRDFVCSVARHLGFSEQEIAEIEISVDEACANAMEHAYCAAELASKSKSTSTSKSAAVSAAESESENTSAYPPDDLQVELYLSADRMKIRISDNGAGTPDLDHTMSIDAYLDINREKFRGLGLVLMRKFMDEVNIQANPGKGTIVEMTKLRR